VVPFHLVLEFAWLSYENARKLGFSHFPCIVDTMQYLNLAHNVMHLFLIYRVHSHNYSYYIIAYQFVFFTWFECMCFLVFYLLVIPPPVINLTNDFLLLLLVLKMFFDADRTQDLRPTRCVQKIEML